jgi:hypothetical protein
VTHPLSCLLYVCSMVVSIQVQLRNETLEKIKAHLLGRDETGVVTEPSSHYYGNSAIMFERDLRGSLSPWTKDDLKLKCENCGLENEEVSTRRFSHHCRDDEYHTLCDECDQKQQFSF